MSPSPSSLLAVASCLLLLSSCSFTAAVASGGDVAAAVATAVAGGGGGDVFGAFSATMFQAPHVELISADTGASIVLNNPAFESFFPLQYEMNGNIAFNNSYFMVFYDYFVRIPSQPASSSAQFQNVTITYPVNSTRASDYVSGSCVGERTPVMYQLFPAIDSGGTCCFEALATSLETGVSKSVGSVLSPFPCHGIQFFEYVSCGVNDTMSDVTVLFAAQVASAGEYYGNFTLLSLDVTTGSLSYVDTPAGISPVAVGANIATNAQGTYMVVEPSYQGRYSGNCTQFFEVEGSGSSTSFTAMGEDCGWISSQLVIGASLSDGSSYLVSMITQDVTDAFQFYNVDTGAITTKVTTTLIASQQSIAFLG